MNARLFYFHEPENCPSCKARRQYNIDGQIIHARAGTIKCPPVPFSEDPVLTLLQALRTAA